MIYFPTKSIALVFIYIYIFFVILHYGSSESLQLCLLQLDVFCSLKADDGSHHAPETQDWTNQKVHSVKLCFWQRKSSESGSTSARVIFWFWKSPVWPWHTFDEELALGHASEPAVSFANRYSSLASRPQPIPAYCKNFLFLCGKRGHAFIQLLLIIAFISDNSWAPGQTHTLFHTVSKERCTLFLWERGFGASGGHRADLWPSGNTNLNVALWKWQKDFVLGNL